MAKVSNQQVSLKPQDLFVLLALLSYEGNTAGYAELSEKTGLALSAVHASVKRAAAARLAMFKDRRPVVLTLQLKEFLIHGAKYAFPASMGSLTRGVATAYATAPMNKIIVGSADPIPVWPHPFGPDRGISLAPLYPTVPDAALRDAKLYEVLALFDALRAGQAREREYAAKLLEDYFA